MCPCCDTAVSLFPPTKLLGYITQRVKDTECVIEAWSCPRCSQHFFTINAVDGLAPEPRFEQLTLL